MFPGTKHLSHSLVSATLLFALSCGKQTQDKAPAAVAPEDVKRDYLAEATAAKVSFEKARMFNAEMPLGNPAAALNGAFSPQFAWPIIPAHVALMPNGKVFNYGTDQQGNQGSVQDPQQVQAFGYDIWSPELGTDGNSHQTLPNRTGTDIFCGATAVLPDTGDVLVPGGDTRKPVVNQGIQATSILNSQNNLLNRAADMQFSRWYPTAITLPSGETMIQGGRDVNGNPVATAEIYSNGNWRTVWGTTNGDIVADQEGRWFYPRNFVAPNGRIFGMSGDRMYWLDWQGQGGNEVLGQRVPNKSRSHISTAVMYQPGKILQVGGSVYGDTQAEGSNQAITVDITGGNPVIENAPNMAKRRVWANSTVLPNGEVLITGGSAFENKLNDPATVAEIWNPNTRQFRQVATAATARLYHSVALLLPDATVLVAGGGAPGPLNNLNGEIFYPPYLFNGNGGQAARLSIGAMGDRFNYGNNVNVPYYGAGQVARVTLVRNGAVTHSFDAGQRFVELNFTNQNGAVEVQMPNSPNIAPPGYYMLFLVNEAGVPSVSKIINITNEGGATVQPQQPQGAGVNVGDVVSLLAQHSNKCADVAGASAANGAAIQQYDCNGTAAQKFRVVPHNNGGLALVNLNSNKCLDVEAVAMQNGAQLQQWDCGGGDNQAVRFEASANGSYHVIFGHSNKCLDVPAANQANGVRLQQWECGAGANQNWTVIK